MKSFAGFALSLLIAVLAITCQPSNEQWVILDLDFFSVRVPKGWTAYREQGFDTSPGVITNQQDTLYFDYGLHAGQITGTNADQHLYGQAMINGLTAIIQIPRKLGKGSIRVSIPHASEEIRFNIGGHDVHDTETVLKILRTLRFKDSDTIRNTPWTEEMFKTYPFGSGRTLYYYYCTPCHMEHRQATGPAMKDILATRSNAWIVNFLYNRQAIPVDSLFQSRIMEAQDTCMRVEKFTRQDAEQIVQYLREN